MVIVLYHVWESVNLSIAVHHGTTNLIPMRGWRPYLKPRISVSVYGVFGEIREFLCLAFTENHETRMEKRRSRHKSRGEIEGQGNHNSGALQGAESILCYSPGYTNSKVWGLPAQTPHGIWAGEEQGVVRGMRRERNRNSFWQPAKVTEEKRGDF